MKPHIITASFFLLACLVFAQVGFAGEKTSTASVNTAPLSIEIPSVGDFYLADAQGSIFLVGRMVVDFSSIYTVLVDSTEARGECPFMVSEIREGHQVGMSMHSMRYFIRDGKSLAYLYGDLPKNEIALEFNFTPGKEFAEGGVRVFSSGDEKVVGIFKMRIRDAEKKPAAK
jgi:hypothetical protein